MAGFLSKLIEDREFDEIQQYFLIVGHTHSYIDQYFSVLSKAIRHAAFIGALLRVYAYITVVARCTVACLRVIGLVVCAQGRL